jgi:hypothetical protein
MVKKHAFGSHKRLAADWITEHYSDNHCSKKKIVFFPHEISVLLYEVLGLVFDERVERGSCIILARIHYMPKEVPDGTNAYGDP